MGLRLSWESPVRRFAINGIGEFFAAVSSHWPFV
jgi:hypothetical protein